MRKSFWVVAGLSLSLSLALHLLLAWAWFAKDTPIGAPEPGDGGMTITLAEPGALAGDEAVNGEREDKVEAAETPAESEPLSPGPAPEPEPEPEPEAAPELDTVIEPEPEPEPEPAPAPDPVSQPLPETVDADAVTPEIQMPDQPHLPEPIMLEPLSLPQVLAADGIVQPRKRRRKPELHLTPEILPLLNTANTVAVRQKQPASDPPKIPEQAKPLAPAARVELTREFTISEQLPVPAELQPIEKAAETPRRTAHKPAEPRKPPVAIKPLRVARPVPPPPPSRPPSLTRQAKPRPVMPPSKPRKTTATAENSAKTAAAPPRVAKNTANDTAKQATRGGGAKAADGATGRVRGEGGQARASQGGTGKGQARRRGGAQVGLQAGYLQTVRAWLERHKRYPRRAKRRQHQGVATLRFVVDQNGQVLSYKILRGTGHTMLDDAVHDMIRRAQPLPAMPENLTAGRLALTVPVAFSLR